MKNVIYIILLFTFFNNQSQTRKSIVGYRFNNPPVIDGKLNESEWKKITPAEGFTFIRPETKAGEKLPDDYKSKVYFGYDNNAIYVGAQLNHPNPENIAREFGPRDIGIFSKSEAFWISLDTYDDRSNYFSFFVTSAGTVADLFQSGDKGDINYDTVFDAKIDFNKSGWSLEMFIPYSAIRFPKKDIQNWGLNFVRRVLDFNGDFVWNPVDKRIFKYHESMGLLKNISTELTKIQSSVKRITAFESSFQLKNKKMDKVWIGENTKSNELMIKIEYSITDINNGISKIQAISANLNEADQE